MTTGLTRLLRPRLLAFASINLILCPAVTQQSPLMRFVSLGVTCEVHQKCLLRHPGVEQQAAQAKLGWSPVREQQQWWDGYRFLGKSGVDLGEYQRPTPDPEILQDTQHRRVKGLRHH